MKSNVDRFNALEQQHLTPKPIHSTGRRFSKPTGENGVIYEDGDMGDDGDRSPSPISLDVSSFYSFVSDLTSSSTVLL